MEASTGGRLVDVASMVFPFGKLGKIGKDIAEAFIDLATGADRQMRRVA